jgi:hypothetical protein
LNLIINAVISKKSKSGLETIVTKHVIRIIEENYNPTDKSVPKAQRLGSQENTRLEITGLSGHVIRIKGIMQGST